MKRAAFILVLVAASLVNRQADADIVTINTDSTGGWVRAAANFGNTNHIVGFSTGSVNYNGIMFFQLPTLAPTEFVNKGVLSFPVSNTGTLSGANADIWSLGLQTTPTRSNTQFIESNTDGVSGHAKLVDNFIASGVFVTGTPTTTTAQSISIGSYIKNLYDTLGYANVAGKYLVIRVNTDASGDHGGFRFNAPSAGNPVKLTLTIVPAPAALPAGVALLALVTLRRK
ncbi:MAG: hypothetical protein GC162_09090 [Planctomycetes bacterium]|nr:hypothetical protein [Planctomycetota bacterium]